MNFISLLVIQTTSLCNLNCSYCYLSENQRKISNVFALDSVYAVCLKVFISPFVSESNPIKILWHAGEPLLLPISYYQAFIENVQKALRDSGRGLSVCFDLQTNGQLLNEDWCLFFNENDITVGVSCDGPQHLHDQHRRYWYGGTTHQQVVEAMKLLEQHNVKWMALATIPPDSLFHEESFFNFFLESNTSFLGLNFLRQVAQYKQNPLSKCYQEVHGFIERLFGLYLKHRLSCPEHYMRIREFEHVIDSLQENSRMEITEDFANPFHMITVSTNGDFSIYDPQLLTADTDYYAGGNFVVGNLLTDSLEKVIQSPKFQAIYHDVVQGIEMCRQTCDYFQLCNGCYIESKQGEHGTFLTTVTTQCVITTQIIANVVIDGIQRWADTTSIHTWPFGE